MDLNEQLGEETIAYFQQTRSTGVGRTKEENILHLHSIKYSCPVCHLKQDISLSLAYKSKCHYKC